MNYTNTINTGRSNRSNAFSRSLLDFLRPTSSFYLSIIVRVVFFSQLFKINFQKNKKSFYFYKKQVTLFIDTTSKKVRFKLAKNILIYILLT